MDGWKHPGVHTRQVLGECLLQPAAGAGASPHGKACFIAGCSGSYRHFHGTHGMALLLQNWDREAAEDQPIIVNPLRHSIPPQFRNGEKLVCPQPAAVSAGA